MNQEGIKNRLNPDAVDQLVSDLAIELKMLLEIPLLSRFKEVHPSLYNGQETTTLVDSSV